MKWVRTIVITNSKEDLDMGGGREAIWSVQCRLEKQYIYKLANDTTLATNGDNMMASIIVSRTYNWLKFLDKFPYEYNWYDYLFLVWIGWILWSKKYLSVREQSKQA